MGQICDQSYDRREHYQHHSKHRFIKINIVVITIIIIKVLIPFLIIIIIITITITMGIMGTMEAHTMDQTTTVIMAIIDSAIIVYFNQNIKIFLLETSLQKYFTVCCNEIVN